MSKFKLTTSLDLRGGVLRRAKDLLRGAPKNVKQHRVTSGLNENEAGQRKVDYSGKLTNESLVDVAMMQEFGTGNMPMRSWLRTWFDQHLTRLKDECTAAMRREYKGDTNAVRQLGIEWELQIKNWIIHQEASLDPLAERTLEERKKAGIAGDTPLYATHQLVEAIRSMVDAEYVD